jgi:predicted DsbA family dithiol-disulfide isomerase
MAEVSATVLMDPYCPWSWAAEPQLRRLQVEFGDSVAFTFVIEGLHRRVRPRRVTRGELWEATATATA